MCLVHIIYGFLPCAPIDLMPLPSSEKLNFDATKCAKLMLKLHEMTKENIEIDVQVLHGILMKSIFIWV